MEAKEITAIIKGLADAVLNEPHKLKFDVVETRTALTLTLKATPEDHGRLIGKGGATFKALRRIGEAMAERIWCDDGQGQGGDTLSFKLVVVQPDSLAKSKQRFVDNPKWPCGEVVKLFIETARAVFIHVVGVTPDHNSTSTTFKCAVDNEPNPEIVDAFGVVFHAIGRNKGRVLFTDIHAA